MKKAKPQDFSTYRLITGPDDVTFCHRVSEALELGYELYGSPSVTYNSDKNEVIAAQAVVWSNEQDLY